MCVRLVTAPVFAVPVGGCAQVGPEVTSGPGWRFVGTVDPVRTGIGRVPDVVVGPAGSAPVVVQSDSDLLEVVGSRSVLQLIPDFARDLVVVFPVPYGGCGEPVLRSVTISEKKHRVDARIEYRGLAAGRSRRPAWPEQPRLVCEHDGLGTAGDAQFHQQPRHMSFDRGLADAQVAGDLGVGQALSDQHEDLSLPGGELLDRGHVGRGRPGERLD
jgi:hypothetical protein